ncbi:RND transporter [Flavipsychrobacter stenotrophus]|uniref:RND transporter n=1 Tax=Flavipsychrobacter stenotrophus TaxID=2077091 RepID=A0A2S7SQH2_9BACT|nr:HlyD family efflux transporter periplasmic adaptor subunit [Flavipsychrobacter stenotrophus]PQJ08806.1 RND transporter [Flavipsychrobacter stenotrophus]
MLSICKRFIPLLSLCLYLWGCKGKAGETTAETTKEVTTPVTVTNVVSGPISEYIELNATSSFLRKSYVKANAGGYIQTVNIRIGKFVSKGEVLFTVKTKESQSIGNTISKLDPSFKFSGENKIVATSSGYITQLSHQSGDYVQDGEQLAVISDRTSFAFILNLPYELRRYIAVGKNVALVLPDATVLQGVVESSLPVMDSASQTESYIIRTSSNIPLPENLIARAKIVKTQKGKTQSLPKSAILSNDIQTTYWVMKISDSTTAVKVEITKGIETKDWVEILAPSFSQEDKILVTGNYGLSDTAKVKIVQ